MMTCNNSTLVTYGGWKSPNLVLYPARHYVSLLREIVSEPSLFLMQDNRDIAASEYFDDATTFEDDDTIVNSPLEEVAPGYLRYVVVLPRLRFLGEAEHARLQRECNTEAATKSSVVDKIAIFPNHAILVIGIKIESTPQAVIDNIIITANGDTPFLRFHSLITNTHLPYPFEIEK